MVPILTKGTLDFISRSSAQTERVGERLAQLSLPGDVICLEGDLGAGKTCLARGIGVGLGVKEPVTSPTFVMINEHRVPGRPFRLYHIDLYRITSPAEALALGLDEYLYDDGICVIEWPELAEQILPRERLWIKLGYVDENKRSLTVTATGERYHELLSQLGKSAFGIANL